METAIAPRALAGTADIEMAVDPSAGRYGTWRILCWLDACAEHLRVNPASRLDRMGWRGKVLVTGNDDDDDAYGCRQTLALNRNAGDALPRPWLRGYYDAVLAAFERDPTVLVERAVECDGALRVDWSHAADLDVHGRPEGGPVARPRPVAGKE